MSLASETSAPIRHADRFFIGGRWVAPSSDATIKVIDSGTEETYFTVAEAQAADISRPAAAAREAFDNGPWPRLSHGERAGYLRAIGAELAKRAGEIGQIWPRVRCPARHRPVRWRRRADDVQRVRRPGRHDELLEALAGTFSQVRVGDPFDAQTQMGPLVASRQRDRVEGYIAQGIAAGATLAVGGGRPKHLERGWFVEPPSSATWTTPR